MKRRPVVLAMGAIAVGALVIALRPPARAIVEVEAGEIRQRLVARAVVEPADGVTRLRAPSSGAVQEVMVHVGDTVKAGQVLLTYTAGQPSNMGTITAPVAGAILARRAAPGDTLGSPASEPVFEIADLSRLEIRIEVDEDAAGRVAVGQPLALRTAGGAAVLAEGHIERIGPGLEPRQTSATRERRDEHVRPAWLSVAPAAGLVVGQELEAVIDLERRQVRGRLPRGAVRIADGRAVVALPQAFGARNFPVRLGASDTDYVEVVGVEPGTRVIALEEAP